MLRQKKLLKNANHNSPLHQAKDKLLLQPKKKMKDGNQMLLINQERSRLKSKIQNRKTFVRALLNNEEVVQATDVP